MPPGREREQGEGGILWCGAARRGHEAEGGEVGGVRRCCGAAAAWRSVSEVTCSTLTRPICISGRMGLMRRPSNSRVGVTS